MLLRAIVGNGRSFSGAARLVLQCGLAVLSCCLFAQDAPRKSEKHKEAGQASSQAGRQTFESTCASCHGLDGRGGERGPDIATRPEVVRLTDEQISKILRTGVPQSGMPSFAALGSARLSATLNHLRVLQGKTVAQRLPGNPEKGKELFTGKAGCSNCHAVQGVGGFLGPDLTSYVSSHSVGDIRDAIVSADRRFGSHKVAAKATTKDGQTISGLVRNEDNFSLQLQSRDGAFHLLTKAELAELTFDSKPLMPDDYATKLSRAELDQLVGYLLSVAQASPEMRAASKAKTKQAEEE